MLGLSILSLFAAFWSPNVFLFTVAAGLIGVTSVAAQIIIPYVAYLSSGIHQGRVLGTVLSGLLTGVLLSRSFSGILGSLISWQLVYLLAAVFSLVLLGILHLHRLDVN